MIHWILLGDYCNLLLKLKERQRTQLEEGLIEAENVRDDGDFRRTVVDSERLEKARFQPFPYMWFMSQMFKV